MSKFGQRETLSPIIKAARVSHDYFMLQDLALGRGYVLVRSKSEAENKAAAEAIRRSAPFRTPSPITGGSIVRLTFNFMLTEYMSRLDERVQANYLIPKFAGPPLAHVSCQVDASGQASNFRIVSSSGDKTLDSAALNAVERSFPFAEFPFKKWAEDRVLQLNFTFSPNGRPGMSTPGLPSFGVLEMSGDVDSCPWIRDRADFPLPLTLGAPVLQYSLAGFACGRVGSENLGPRIQVRANFQ